MTQYYRIQLSSYQDYKNKFDKIVDYLATYDNDETTFCNSVLRDLIVFENDVNKEIELDTLLSIYQVDTLTTILQKVSALNKFIDCIGSCTAHPIILEKYLTTAIDLLQYNVITVQETSCAKVLLIQKERFMFYFIVNKASTYRNIRYLYLDLDRENKSGVTDIPPFAATKLIGVFNDYYSDEAYFRSLQCN